MIRTLLILAILSLPACSRLSDSFGAGPAKGQRGTISQTHTNPAGLKIPKAAVDTTPEGGYWNCGGFQEPQKPEHIVRCTLKK